MRELTEEQLKQMDDVFNEPLSDRGKDRPDDYNPPERIEGEDLLDYLVRVDAYNAGYREHERD